VLAAAPISRERLMSASRASILLCPVLALLGLLAASQAPPPHPGGYLGVSSDAGIFIALDKGYFKKQA